MSKAFTSEESSDDPLVVPARAPLPDGVPNYVTPRGLALLRAELASLRAERAGVDSAPDESRRALLRAALDRRIGELVTRVASAKVVDPRRQDRTAVRFGATVTVRTEGGEARRYTIVGVDEAEATEGRVTFASPIARALTGRKVGDTATFQTAAGEEALQITAIEYGP